jgi:hypothetical protein
MAPPARQWREGSENHDNESFGAGKGRRVVRFVRDEHADTPIGATAIVETATDAPVNAAPRADGARDLPKF